MVSEVSGSLVTTGGSGKRLTTVTVAVHDRAYCYRDVASFRSEDYAREHGCPAAGNVPYLGDTRARRLAQELCDRLNAEYDPLDY